MTSDQDRKWTSVEAEEAASHEFNQAKVFSALYQAGDDGMTDDEIQFYLSMDGNSQRPARLKLCKHGHVKDSGRWRLTSKGFKAIVWQVVKHQN